jgi:hypothetical protein
MKSFPLYELAGHCVDGSSPAPRSRSRTQALAFGRNEQLAYIRLGIHVAEAA